VHNATTKQRIAALRRRLGLFTGRFEGPHFGRMRSALAPAGGAGPVPPPADAAPDEPTTVAPAPDAATVVAPRPDATTIRSTLPAPPADPAPEPVVHRFIPVVAEPTPPLAGAGSAPAGEAAPRPRRRVAWAIAAAVLLAVLAGGLALRRAPGPAPATPAISRPIPAPAAEALAAEPTRAVADGEIEVRAGDTLWDLSRRHLGDPFAWPRLHRANAAAVANPDLIFPGQRLHIPRS